MKDRVVCIDNDWHVHQDCKGKHPPIKGEIYTVVKLWKLAEYPGYEFYELKEMHDLHDVRAFRPVDESFGEYVECTLMKEVELESVTINQ